MKFLPIWMQAMANDVFLNKKRKKMLTSYFSIQSPVSGEAIRLRLSNLNGDNLYQIVGITLKVNEHMHDVTVKSSKSFTLLTQNKTYSDPLKISVKKNEQIEVRICFIGSIADANRIESGSRLIKGNHLYDNTKGKAPNWLSRKLNVYQPIPIIDRIEVQTDENPEMIVAFGDSITALSQWTKPLGERLQTQYQGAYILLNAGISGNCLLYEKPSKLGGFFGEKGIDRFERDVLDIPNLKTVIIGLGVNDVSYYTDKTKDVINLENYQTGICTLVEKLHHQGTRAVMQTITPRLGVSKVMGKYNYEMEKQRLVFNQWIRNASIFDAIFDAEKVVSYHSQTGIRIKEDLHVGDHLHPNERGGKQLANAYELNTLIGD